MSKLNPAQTKLYGVIGNPVRHSLSPLIHNNAFERFKMNAVYLAFEVEKGSLGLAFEAIRSLGIAGANLTIPFKEEAMGLVDEMPEDFDRGVGAINTVVNRNGTLLGFNTDGPGFLTALKEDLRFDPRGKKVLLLGAGGAARGVAFALARARADEIWIHNRTAERGAGLQDYLSQYFIRDIEIVASALVEEIKYEKFDLVVNATSCGMHEHDALPFDLRLFKNQPAVYDLVYAPKRTKFLELAQELGSANANGLGMLAAQAALSFELWTGHKEGVRESMVELLNQ